MSRKQAWNWLMDGVDPNAHFTFAAPIEPQSHHDLEEIEPWMRTHPYLTDPPPSGRGIPEENLTKHSIGYDPLINRIVIPLWWDGDLIGWQTRRIEDDGTAKYMTSHLCKKSRILYNWSEVDNESRYVLVESPLTVVAKTHLIEDGYRFISTLGANVSQPQLDLLSELGEVVIWLDNDEAGKRHTDQLVYDLTARSVNVGVVDSPYREDADELDDDTVFELLENPTRYEGVLPPPPNPEPSHASTKTPHIPRPVPCSTPDCGNDAQRYGRCKHCIWLYGAFPRSADVSRPS